MFFLGLNVFEDLLPKFNDGRKLILLSSLKNKMTGELFVCFLCTQNVLELSTYLLYLSRQYVKENVLPVTIVIENNYLNSFDRTS